MRPELAILLVAPLVVAWLCFVCLMLAQMSGWAALARKYRATEKPSGKQFRFQSGKVGQCNFGSALDIVVSETGLYLAVFPLLRVGHPPLLIPWSDFHSLREKKQLFLWRLVEMRVGTPAITTLTLPLHIIAERPMNG